MERDGCYVNPFVGEGRYARYLRVWLGVVPKRQVRAAHGQLGAAVHERARGRRPALHRDGQTVRDPATTSTATGGGERLRRFRCFYEDSWALGAGTWNWKAGTWIIIA